MVDLIRARIESILASRIQESTRFIRAFDGVEGGGRHLEGKREGRVCRDGRSVNGGDAGGDAKGFGAVGGEVCPVLDGGRVVNGGAVLIFWDVGFVGVLLGGAGGLGGECSRDAELNGDGGGAFVELLGLL